MWGPFDLPSHEAIPISQEPHQVVHSTYADPDEIAMNTVLAETFITVSFRDTSLDEALRLLQDRIPMHNGEPIAEVRMDPEDPPSAKEHLYGTVGPGSIINLCEIIAEYAGVQYRVESRTITFYKQGAQSGSRD